MHKITLLLFISIIALFTCKPSDSKAYMASNQTNNILVDSLPILVMRSYFNNNEDISIENLRKGLNAGNIVCTSDIAERVKKALEIKGSLKVSTLNSFDLTDTSLFILTSIDSVTPSLLCTSVDKNQFFKSTSTYTLWIPDSSHIEWGKAITSYTHTGVTALTRRTGTVLNTIGNEKYLELIKSAIGNPDILHISNEVSMQTNCDYSSMKMKFATSSKHFEILELLGADIIELTGNHNLDVGTLAYETTHNWYKEHGMKTFGGGITPSEAAAPMIITLKDKKKIAWIGFNEFCPCGECADILMGANRYHAKKSQALIHELKTINKVDYIIACVQFGESDSYLPSSSQTKISKFLIDCGADVIIGSQAHQAQTFELYKNRMIFYGIGNFMFDQVHRLGVRQAFFLECYFYNGKIIQFIPRFTFMGDDRRPALANSKQRNEIEKAVYLKNYFCGKY